MKKFFILFAILTIAAACLFSCGSCEQTEDETYVKGALFQFGLTPFQDADGKYGYVNKRGKWVIEPQFFYAYGFNEKGLAAVSVGEKQSDAKHGFINTNGVFVIEPRYEECYFESADGFIRAYENGKCTLFDATGNMLIYPRYETIYIFDENGYAKVKTNGKWGIVDTSGKAIIQTKYDFFAEYNIDGLSAVGSDGSISYIDRWGIVKFKLKYRSGYGKYDYARNFNESGRAFVSMNKKWGLIDQDQNFIIEPQFIEIVGFDDFGIAWGWGGGKWYMIDSYGNILNENTPFDGCWSFDEHGLAWVRLDGKAGLLNTSCEWAIEPIYDELINDIFPTNILVKTQDKWKIIDRAGAAVSKDEFDEICFPDGDAILSKLDGKWGFLSENGEWKEVKNCEFDYAYSFYDGLLTVVINKRYGIFDCNKGEFLVEPTYGQVYLSSDGYSRAMTSDSIVIFDPEGNVIAETKIDENNRHLINFY